MQWRGSGRFSSEEFPSWIMNGRWSELRVVKVKDDEVEVKEELKEEKR